MGKKASQAGHECMPSSKEMILRSEATLKEEPDERERLDACKTWEERRGKLEKKSCVACG